MIVGDWVVEWKGDGAGGVWVCGCVAWVWEVRMRGASPRSGAFWCERSGREERREEPGRLLHVWCDLLRIKVPGWGGEPLPIRDPDGARRLLWLWL